MQEPSQHEKQEPPKQQTTETHDQQTQTQSTTQQTQSTQTEEHQPNRPTAVVKPYNEKADNKNNKWYGPNIERMANTRTTKRSSSKTTPWQAT